MLFSTLACKFQQTSEAQAQNRFRGQDNQLCQISAYFRRTISGKSHKALEGQEENNPNPRFRKKEKKELLVTPERTGNDSWRLLGRD